MGNLRSIIKVESEGLEDFLALAKKAKKELKEISKILESKGFKGNSKELKNAAIAYRREFLKAIKDVEAADLSRIRKVMEAQKSFASNQDTPEAKSDLQQLEIAGEVMDALKADTDEAAESLAGLSDSLEETSDSSADFSEGFEATEEQIINTALSIADLKERNKEIKEVLDNAPREGSEGFEELRDTISVLTEEFAENRDEILEYNRGLRRGTQSNEAASGSIIELSESVRSLTKEYNALGKEQREGLDGQKLREEIRSTTEELNEQRAAIGNNRGFVGAYERTLNGLGKPLGFVKTATNAFNGALKLLAANPIVLIVTLLVGAVTALFKAFATTKEGSEFLEQASAALGAALDVVRDVAVTLGKALVGAFKDPIGSLKALGKALLENIINRVKGAVNLVFALGKALKAVATRDLEALRAAADDAADALAQVNTGLTPEQQRRLAEATRAVAEEIRREAAAAAALTAELQRVTDIQRALSVERAKLNTALIKSRDAARDANTPLNERIKLLKDVSKQENELIDQEITAQARRLAATRALAAQSNSDAAALDKVAQEEIKLEQLKQQSSTRTLTINRQLRQLNNQRRKESADAAKKELAEIASISKARQALLTVIINQNQKRKNALTKLANDLKQIEIEAIEDNTKQALAREQERYRLQKAARDENFNKQIDEQLKALAEVKATSEKGSSEAILFEEKVNADILKLTEINNKILQAQEKEHQGELAGIKNTAAAAAADKRKEDFDRIEAEREEREASEAKAISDNQQAEAKRIDTRNKSVKDAAISAVQTAFSAVSSIMQIAANAENEFFDNAIQKRADSISQLNEDLKGATGVQKIYLEQQIQQEKEAQEKLQKQADKARKDQAEAQRIVQLTQAVVNGALAVTQALGSAPPPASFILAGAAAAAAAVQIATISTQKFKDGGEVKGALHSQGGVRASVQGSSDVELEGGEIIFSRRAVNFHGKENLLEANSRGNAAPKKFEFGGEVAPNFRAIAKSDNGEQERLLRKISDMKIFVDVTEISNLQEKRAEASNIGRI